MTDLTGKSFPSRRALRESAPSEASPILSRRELRLREEQARTLEPTLTQSPSPVPPAPPSDWGRGAPAEREGRRGEDPQTYLPPPTVQAPVTAPSTATSPVFAPPPSSLAPSAPLLSRRERRVLEQQQSGGISLAPEGGSPEPVTPIAPSQEQQRMPWEREVVSEGHASTTFASPSTQPVVTEPTPLPPVFAPTPQAQRSPDFTGDVDVMTAATRTVGAGPLPTHALILPTAPSLDVSGPLGTTGEILVTGQIPLPQSMSETGIHGVLDDEADSSGTFDRLIGAESSFTAPMRAVQAISSRGEGREFQIVRKPRWSVGAIILGVSAVLLVLAAGALIAVALLTDTIQLPFL